MIVSAHDVRFPQLGEREIQCVSYIDVYLITTLILHKHRPWHAFCSRLAEYKWLPTSHTAARHHSPAIAKNVNFVWKNCKWDFQLSTRFIKFPALLIFGVTLTLLVTLTFDLRSPKKICTIPGVCLTYVPKMKTTRPLVSDEFGHKHTDKQRTYGYYSID